MSVLTYLDGTGIDYLLMIIVFLLMTRLNNKLMDENKRLRRLLKNTVLED